MNARLISVKGEEEFADLIGVYGTLNLEHNWFLPNDDGDMLSFLVKRKTFVDDKVKVFTKLGNIFTFRVLRKTQNGESDDLAK